VENSEGSANGLDAHTSMISQLLSLILLVHLYDDGTVQVSILYGCSLLIELNTYN
jgi:hypothetical protein